MARWREIKKHLTKPFPEGWFYPKEKVGKRAAMIIALLENLTILIFVWLAINAPVGTTKVAGEEVVKGGGLKWRWLGIIYAVMATFEMAGTGTELLMPEKFKPAAIPMPGGGDWGILECVVVGIAIAGGVMIFSSFAFATTGIHPFTLQVFPKLPLANWLIVGFSIPLIEEAFFGKVWACTITENRGLLVGLTVPSFIFAIFHWGVYGLSLPLLLPIFLFRTLATLSMVFSRSWLPGVVGHILINTASVMMVF